jgi:uncharacterized protein
MITEENLKQIIDDQQKLSIDKKVIAREQQFQKNSKRIQIISGIRRCGKSTFLKQLLKEQESLYVNFEDPRLEGFELNDFYKIEKIATQKNKKAFLFDEIQNIFEWEKYARAAYDKEIKLYVTGSNASLMSKELGTKLTGRYLQVELFPFSYSEFLIYTKQVAGQKSFNNYLENGGFPEFLAEMKPEYLRTLLRDIIMRDIAVRRDIRNEHLLIRLAVHILSNIGKEFSYNSVSNNLEIKSVRTTIDYCDFLQETYLIELIPRFTFSIKQRQMNPKKAYCIDNALARANSLSFSVDKGRKLENTIYLFLRRKDKEIFYYRNNKTECDFLIKENEKIVKVIQVCSEVTQENKMRELQGVKDAMIETGCKEGLIVTLNQEDELNGIPLIPAWKWMF